MTMIENQQTDTGHCPQVFRQIQINKEFKSTVKTKRPGKKEKKKKSRTCRQVSSWIVYLGLGMQPAIGHPVARTIPYDSTLS